MTSLRTRAGDATPGRPSTSSRPGPGAGPPVREEPERIHRLRAMKRRATGLLVVMAVAFVVITVLGDNTGWTGYLQAAVAASLVGGVADWFAVTAVFRHPLGVPIPHTAVIVERKEKFGETLGAFVQENFLSSDAMTAAPPRGASRSAPGRLARRSDACRDGRPSRCRRRSATCGHAA